MSHSPNTSAALGTVTPYFTVPDAEAFIHFAQSAFDAEIIKQDRYDSGVIQHARLQIGSSVLMLNQATEAYTANNSQMHVQVADTATTYARALALGATAIMQPNLRPHGEHMAGIVDPSGNTWWIASPAP